MKLCLGCVKKKKKSSLRWVSRERKRRIRKERGGWGYPEKGREKWWRSKRGKKKGKVILIMPIAMPSKISLDNIFKLDLPQLSGFINSELRPRRSNWVWAFCSGLQFRGKKCWKLLCSPHQVLFSPFTWLQFFNI